MSLKFCALIDAYQYRSDIKEVQIKPIYDNNLLGTQVIGDNDLLLKQEANLEASSNLLFSSHCQFVLYY